MNVNTWKNIVLGRKFRNRIEFAANIVQPFGQLAKVADAKISHFDSLDTVLLAGGKNFFCMSVGSCNSRGEHHDLQAMITSRLYCPGKFVFGVFRIDVSSRSNRKIKTFNTHLLENLANVGNRQTLKVFCVDAYLRPFAGCRFFGP